MANQRIREVFNASIPNGTSATVDVNLDGASFLTLWAQLQGTVTTTDLTDALFLFRKDGTTSAGIGLPTVRNSSVQQDGANVNQTAQWDVRGLGKVRLQITNNNAAPKTGVMTVYLGG